MTYPARLDHTNREDTALTTANRHPASGPSGRRTPTRRAPRAALVAASVFAAALTPISCAGDPGVQPPTVDSPAESTTGTTVSTPPAADPYAGRPLIDHTTWTQDSDGRRLRVYPTIAGREDTWPGADERAWQEVLAMAPDADTPGMRDQFVCHWVWARMVMPNKESWNLEPWRPAVGYEATVAAQCNPGGSQDPGDR
ncbi:MULTISPECIES: DUF2599 domain-containing protein [unclassified Nocardia]|uniref:DUF2599 domain-containing protein n=1 Tax=unclassified Nocardia TaxID=2637762 RepID=UPI001CE3E719|nr:MULTISPECIES: DUF2599 domain-containing protein [unclassified Nocardia]